MKLDHAKDILKLCESADPTTLTTLFRYMAVHLDSLAVEWERIHLLDDPDSLRRRSEICLMTYAFAVFTKKEAQRLVSAAAAPSNQPPKAPADG